jgi:hypothetical protein
VPAGLRGEAPGQNEAAQRQGRDGHESEYGIDLDVKGGRTAGGTERVAGGRVLRDDAVNEQVDARDGPEPREPNGGTSGRKRAAPAERRAGHGQAADDDIDLLHLATRTQAERTDSLLPGAVPGAGCALDRIGCGK